MHPHDPGSFAFKEFGGEEFVCVEPVWGHATMKGLANVCMVEHLFQSNREALYRQVCKVVLKEACKIYDTSPSGNTQKFPFEKVGIPGDGRCGWRAILAAQNLKGFLAIPRTATHDVRV